MEIPTWSVKSDSSSSMRVCICILLCRAPPTYNVVGFRDRSFAQFSLKNNKCLFIVYKR